MMSNVAEIIEVTTSPSLEGTEEAASVATVEEGSAMPLKRIRLEEFSSPITLADAQKDAYLRRFNTLFVDEARTREGGTSEVLHAVNAFGEHFALKVRKPGEKAGGQEGSADPSFRREYQAHRLLSDLKGYPYLYGRARLGGRPTIVMEWIEGEDLLHARRRMAVDDEGRLSPLTAARLGRDLFDILARTGALEQEVVHGDLSLRNILISTKQQPIEAQIQEGAFDLRLIDLSSSRVAPAASDPAQANGSADEDVAFEGGATQEFAAPELREGSGGAKVSQAADVHAIASIICLLVYGSADPSKAPQAYMTAHDEANDIAVVLGREPEVAVAVQRASAELAPYPTAQEIAWALEQVDEPLAELLNSCLSQDPAKRPSATAMRDALDSFCVSYAGNIGRALRGEQLEPCRASFIRGGVDGVSLRARNLIRVIGKSVSLGLYAAVVLTTALVLHSGHASIDVGDTHLEGAGVGMMAALFVVPGILGLLLRGARHYSLAGFVRASLGVVAGGVCLGAAAAMASFTPSAMQSFYGWAAFAATVMTWCPFVLDCAFPASSARIWRRPRALPDPGSDALSLERASVKNDKLLMEKDGNAQG